MVGAVAPLVVGVGLWTFLSSPFALVGAVLGPAMVVAHYADAVRRFRRDARRQRQRDATENAARERERISELTGVREDLNRRFPSIRHMCDAEQWTPPMDGRREIRAGSQSRDGLAGFPWLVDLTGGVAVEGHGVAAEAVWRTLLTQGCVSHGGGEYDTQHMVWPSGGWIHRGRHSEASLTVRCSGGAIDSVTIRGHLPERGDWRCDDTSGWETLMAQIVTDGRALSWSDRSRCDHGIGCVGERAVTLDVNSESPHVLVCGRTGTGKSEFLAALLCDWSERFTPEQLSWVGFDFKGGATLSPLDELPHCTGIVTDLDGDLVHRAIKGLAAEMRERESRLQQECVARIDDSSTIGRLVVVIDEFPELVRICPDALPVLADIARRGRSLGVHIVLSTQSVSSVHRDGLAANIAMRVCFPLATEHDVTSVLGARPRLLPATGRPVVVTADGAQSRVTVRCGASPSLTNVRSGMRQPTPWLRPLLPPVTGDVGFGLVDDVVARTHEFARWDGADVVVVGQRGSGRSTALSRLVRNHKFTVARTLDEILIATGIVVIDDLDRLYDELPDSRKHELATVLAVRRREATPPTFVMSVTAWVPRLHGLVPNVVVLALPTRDAHTATGEPLETFDPSAKPGVGSWRGRRVVVYASTDSIDTESIP